MEPDFYTIDQMANKLNVKVKALYNKRCSRNPGDIPPSVKICGKIQYPRKAYESWLAEQNEEAA